MAVNAITSQGGKLQVSISSVFTDIPNVKSFDIPTPPLVFDDTSTLDDAGGFPTRIVVGKDFKEFTVPLVLDMTSAVHQFLLNAYENDTIVSMKAINSSGSLTAAFSAYVETNPHLETRKAELMDVTFKLTGGITYTIV